MENQGLNYGDSWQNHLDILTMVCQKDMTEIVRELENYSGEINAHTKATIG